MHRTKIVCTIGPAVDQPAMIRQLIEAGMNGARLNFSHGTHEEHQVRIDCLKQARAEMGVPLAIILDTKGPEVRLGKLLADLEIKEGDRFKLVDEAGYAANPNQTLPINPPCVVERLPEGINVLIDDGYLSATVEGTVSSGGVYLRMKNNGLLKSRKSLNVPGANLQLPALTEKDRGDMLFAIKNEVDWIAASFIRSAEHVLEIKHFLARHGGHKILVASKIESQEGVDHFDEIVAVSDGIMVARGDLGVEVPLAQVPRLQKMMIRKAYRAGKPVVTATQMLESMIQNPRPTRAEVSDVANAIYDSTSAVMLSGETAVGKYPIETVQTMRKIADEAESDFDYRRFLGATSDQHLADVTSSIAMAAVQTAFNSQAKAIFCFTHSGRTARLISSYRPKMRILANTTDPQVYHQMALTWGVEPILTDQSLSLEEGFHKISSLAQSHQWVEEGDLVLMTAGTPFGVSGSTNVMMLDFIGDVLLRAKRGYGARVEGNVIHFHSTKEDLKEGSILILRNYNALYEPMIAKAAGVILEMALDDSQSEDDLIACCTRLGVSCLIGGDGAAKAVGEGSKVRLDPERALLLRVKIALR